jgi:hypothetical protein
MLLIDIGFLLENILGFGMGVSHMCNSIRGGFHVWVFF